MPGVPDPVYVRAKRVLLDTLEALREHQSAVLLVGAQAIYLHTGDADLAVAPYTADADLLLNPAVLAGDPKLDMLMRGAGFIPAPEPDRIGTWIGPYDVPVDLLVPEAMSGPGRRAARWSHWRTRLPLLPRAQRSLVTCWRRSAPEHRERSLAWGALEPGRTIGCGGCAGASTGTWPGSGSRPPT